MRERASIFSTAARVLRAYRSEAALSASEDQTFDPGRFIASTDTLRVLRGYSRAVSFLDQIGLEHPIVQAGMGGGIATGALAGEVSAAGGLGTVGMLSAGRLRDELLVAGEGAGKAPIAANLLVPFARPAHVEACRAGEARVVVLHGGFKAALVDQLKADGAVVLQTVGTQRQARWALGVGVDGVVLQGVEAGGHLVGAEPALEALPRVLDEAAGAPVLLAGGIAVREDAQRALQAGATAAVAGTRFLLSEECSAHAAYKRRVLAAERTIETQLFGLGWPMRHRVAPNAATDRWCRNDPLGPRFVRALQAISTPLARLPLSVAAGMVRTQRPSLPIFGPSALLEGMPPSLVDASPLYAGESALRIDGILRAVDAVRQLAGVAGEGSPTIPE